MNIIATISQLALFIGLAPILSGIISKIKNNIRMRKGASIFQPYYNLAKLFSKKEVISETSSWIFRSAPFIVFSSNFIALLLIIGIFKGPINRMGDLLVLVFVFALGRFFTALAALDTGSAFGGMGSSREVFISSLVEPALCMVIFSISLQSGSTDISVFNNIRSASVSSIVSAIALFLITIVETSRIPIDNQETHLELTMAHEAMILEYSGKSLALLEISSYIKQVILFFLIAQIAFPISLPGINKLIQMPVWALWYLAGIIIISVTVAIVEISVAKMRLFRVVDFIGFSFVLGVIAAICAILGV